MMSKLQREDLWSLEEYAQRRAGFRSEVMAHKKHRQVALGDHATLYFEDTKTIRYQIQEMLRIERVFEAAGIQDELDAYNPLIPDGSNLKATFMLEYPDADERKEQLAKLLGIERKVWLQVEGFDPVTPIADEDLERETEEKTSSVHFLRFELTPAMIKAAKQGVPLSMGIDHPNYQASVSPLPEATRASLVADLAEAS
jgi:hypothetical protein